MRKFSQTGRILLGFGATQVFWGLVMLNGINLFEHTSKMVKYSILIIGIVCCIASNFFKEPRSGTNK
ncbi:hypothetical protein ACRS6Y_13815 [Bacillus cytotoxicus]|uniref:hypothetical protein n=1 Tax=Bacillus cytotoxicus TaxID=580165 RepID=UPI00059FA07B|nr:hypothetical protein [Bacillus cytotoxicus]AWC31402.1 hypothetical protein CG482_002275 [Bacillus cytotoxicus]AWC35441.1 hypothetical protein CG481_002275 [Bacillus cytotoxicus]AWC43476.1 hypothetical protein CG479_002220 [Bacillus cytotoxicus]AWC59670.1 hypothetical protein CG474_002340 [Bacillus cytotoxicus]KMT48557.1 hypothetical protein TU51_19095 [Bacillus cytotoxicus]